MFRNAQKRICSKKFGGLTKYELISILIAFNEYKIVTQLLQTESNGSFSFSFISFTYLTLFLPDLVTWGSHKGWFRPWPVGIGLTNFHIMKKKTQVHEVFVIFWKGAIQHQQKNLGNWMIGNFQTNLFLGTIHYWR